MKTEINAASAANVTRLSNITEPLRFPEKVEAKVPPESWRKLPPDIFEPMPPIRRWPPVDPLPPIGGPIGPGRTDPFYDFKLSRMGKEDLAKERAAQQKRADDALNRIPPDFATYLDAKSKLAKIDREQTGRAIEQLGYQLKLGGMNDKQLQGELAKAEKELDAVLHDPFASEADRESARAHVQAVLDEMESRD